MLNESAATKVLDEREDGEQALLGGIIDRYVNRNAVATNENGQALHRQSFATHWKNR